MMWRFGFFWDGLLEGDQGWGGARQNLVLAAIFALPLLAAVFYTLIFPDQPGWLETIPELAQLGIPTWILRFLSSLLHWKSLRFLIVPAIPLVVALMAGAQYIQDIYNLGSFSLGWHYLLSCLFAWDYPRVTIRDGSPKVDKDEVNLLTKIGGPGYVFVTPGNAVLCESLTSPSSVLGEGNYFISRFESLKEIIDLTDQHGAIAQSKAMTKDGIVVTIRDIHFRYRVWGGHRQGGVTGRSPEHPFPFAPSSVRNIVYKRVVRKSKAGTWDVDKWSRTVESSFESEIRNYIRARQLNEIITEGNGFNKARDEIRRKLLSPGLRERLRSIGCELIWFDIGHFTYEEPVVEEEWINTWAADWIGKAEVERTRGDSQRDAVIERARSEAQADILRAMLDELSANNLDGDLDDETLARLFLLKAGEALESMRGGYTTDPNGA